VKRIWIIGGGGFASECHLYLTEAMKRDPKLTFGGFLATSHSLEHYGLECMFRGSYEEHDFEPEDSVVIAIGTPQVRQRLFEEFDDLGVDFYTLIAPSALLSPSVCYGRGNIFCHNVLICPGVGIGDGNLFNVATTVGHDSCIGNFNVLSGHCDITGYAKMGDLNFFGTHAGMLPKAQIGSRCRVGAGSIVYKKFKNDALAVGNPAMKI